MLARALGLSLALSPFLLSTPASAETTTSPPAVAAAKDDDHVHPEDPDRKKTLEPAPAEKPAEKERFIVDPYSDGAVLIIAGSFVGLSQGIISSGELKPQQPSDSAKLTWIDRGAVTQSFDPNAGTYSNYGLYAAIGYAVIDPIRSGISENSWQTFLVDAMMDAESAAITGALTNLTKIAIRRPRPRAYWEQDRLAEEAAAQCPSGNPSDPQCAPKDISETDTALSFVSGHASTVAAISATATHLAFARSPKGSARPWITMIGGILLTSFVSYERVRSGAHFPTDVIAGALIGGAVGVLVPHMHDDEKLTQKHVWVGFEMPRGGGGIASVAIAL